MKRKNVAVFLDRDGTINHDPGYLSEPEKVELIDGAAEAIALINRSGMKAIIITNQSGVARGYFTEERLEQINRRVLELIGSEGASIDAIYYCPHHPDDGCNCRKPMPGLLLRAADEHDIELEASYMVGDKPSDVLAATAAGATGILIDGGQGVECKEAAHVCSNLLEAVRWILEHRGRRGDG